LCYLPCSGPVSHFFRQWRSQHQLEGFNDLCDRQKLKVGFYLYTIEIPTVKVESYLKIIHAANNNQRVVKSLFNLLISHITSFSIVISRHLLLLLSYFVYWILQNFVLYKVICKLWCWLSV